MIFMYADIHIILKPRAVKNQQAFDFEQNYVYWDIENTVFC